MYIVVVEHFFRFIIYRLRSFRRGFGVVEIFGFYMLEIQEQARNDSTYLGKFGR